MDHEEILLQWMAALRSGEYKQARRRLRSGEGFCCLGVACDLFKQVTGEGRWVESDWVKYQFDLDNDLSVGYLPEKIMRWLDLNDSKVDLLVDMNDMKGASFRSIAKAIEGFIPKEGE